MVDEYLSVPTYYGELPMGDELALAANPTLVSRLTGASRDDVRRVARTGGDAGRAAACSRAVRADRKADGARAVKLNDAARCPFCARVRIALAEKGLDHEAVVVDLSDRPGWLVELNPPKGRVPVLDDGFVLPESEVIMAYLDERYPESPLLPVDLAERARARLLVHRFDDLLGDDYYAFRRGDDNDLSASWRRSRWGKACSPTSPTCPG